MSVHTCCASILCTPLLLRAKKFPPPSRDRASRPPRYRARIPDREGDAIRVGPSNEREWIPDGVKAAKTAQLIIPSSVALAVEHRTALYTRLRTAQALPAAPTNGNRTNCPRAAVQNLRPGFARSPRALAMSDDKAKTKKGNVKW